MGAQGVRRESLSGSGTYFRRFERAAERLGRSDWPRVNLGHPGTQVWVTFDPRNADITLVTNASYTLDRLLGVGKRLAADLELPQTDFILSEGDGMVMVDLEFNDYLRRRPLSTEFDLDLSLVAQTLRRLDLPAPVVVALNGRLATPAHIVDASGDASHSRAHLLLPGEVRPGTRVHFEAALTWKAAPIILLWAFIFLGPLIRIVATLRPKKPRPAQTPDPEEVQKRYDRMPAQWVVFVPLVLVMLALPLTMRPGQLSLIFAFLPPWCAMALPVLVLAGIVVPSIVERLSGRGRETTDPEAAAAAREDTPPAAMAAVTVLMTMVPLFVLLGVLALAPPSVGSEAVRHYLRPLVYVMIPWMGVAFWLGHRMACREVKDGPFYQMAQDLAAAAGIRVKRLVLQRSPIANAYVTWWGTVGLTSALVRKLTPDEVRALLAHELGHLRSGHQRRTLFFSLALILVFIVLWQVARATILRAMPDQGRMFVVMSPPLLIVVFLPLVRVLLAGKQLRQREEEADRVAVELTQDPDLVVRALTHLHQCNASPARLKPSDEALSTHPSLAHRVEAIRRLYPARPSAQEAAGAAGPAGAP